MSWLYLLLILGMFSPGCGEPVLYQRFGKPMWANFVHLQDVKLGMTKSEVTGIMGQPGIREEGDYRRRPLYLLFLPDSRHGFRGFQHGAWRLYSPGF